MDDTEIERLGQEVADLIKRSESCNQEYIEGLMRMAAQFRQARLECGSDKAFSQWLIDENLQEIFNDTNRRHKSVFRNAPILRIRK
jgi:hypothetical protein